MKDTIITLYVDTAKIITYSANCKKKKNMKKIDDCILLGDNHNDPAGGIDFTSKISKKSKLAWVGAVMNISENQEDFVIIKKIILKSKKSIIKLNPPKQGAGTTHIDGSVASPKSGTEEEYRIKFLVSSYGTEKTFCIDPKIKMR